MRMSGYHLHFFLDYFHLMLVRLGQPIKFNPAACMQLFFTFCFEAERKTN